MRLFKKTEGEGTLTLPNSFYEGSIPKHYNKTKEFIFLENPRKSTETPLQNSERIQYRCTGLIE